MNWRLIDGMPAPTRASVFETTIYEVLA